MYYCTWSIRIISEENLIEMPNQSITLRPRLGPNFKEFPNGQIQDPVLLG